MSEVPLKRDSKTQRVILPKGTKIKIKSVGMKSLYKERGITSHMYSLRGTIQEINEYHSAFGYNPGYTIMGDTHYWDEGMFDIISIPPLSINHIVYIGKYDKNYIALIDGNFDEKIYSSISEIETNYNECTIKLLF